MLVEKQDFAARVQPDVTAIVHMLELFFLRARFWGRVVLIGYWLGCNLQELSDGGSYICPECRKLQGLSKKHKAAEKYVSTH